MTSTDPSSNTVAFFDFDGTLTTRDSFLAFLKFTHGYLHYVNFILLSPILVLYKLGVISNSKAKEIVFSFYYKGKSESDFLALSSRFCATVIPTIIRKEAYDKLKWHQKQKHRVIVVTASFEQVLLPWIRQEGIEVIGTKLIVIDQKIAGKIKGKNCYGSEKVIRIKDTINISDKMITYGYGDSRGDKEMISLVAHKFYRKF